MANAPSITASPAGLSPAARPNRIGLAAVAQARVHNAWFRTGASALAAVIASAVLGSLWPFAWVAGLALVLTGDRAVFRRILATCAVNPGQRAPSWLIGWTVFQSAYANILAAMLYFAPLAQGDTLAVLYLIAGLANAAATLRPATPLAIAGAAPTLALLLGLPLVDFWFVGASGAFELTPLVGALALLGFAAALWRSLRASDAAVAEAAAAALRESQAAAAAAMAKSDAIARMRDETRIPLATLMGAVERVERQSVSADARADARALAEAAATLRLVLADLAEPDRFELGQALIAPKPTDPRDLVRNVVAAFAAAAHDKGLELFLDIAADAPPLVELDPLRVRQVLSNLIANAIDYTRHGGVRVRLQVQAGDAPGRVRLGFVVADTGIGMSRSQLAIALGRAKLDGDSPGSGFAIARRLARTLGAQLGGKSELGQGSVFSLVIEAPVLSHCVQRGAA